MDRRSDEFKKEVIKKLLPPNATPVPQLHQETGVAKSTLYKWKASYESSTAPQVEPDMEDNSITGFSPYREQSMKPQVEPDTKKSRSGAEKLRIVIETSSMNTAELLTYCRDKGLQAHQILAWKEAAILGNGLQEQLDSMQQKVQGLESELLRKDKALAEIAALLVLQEKEDVG
ncbi:MAG: hypothetical protein Q9N67_10460 [Ghiorsea sp.]|nr:hypothetical protein [Ghiorsea sp.]